MAASGTFSYILESAPTAAYQCTVVILCLVRSMQRIAAVAVICVLTFCALGAHAAPARILTHTYGSGSQAVLITLVDILPSGPVRILSSSPSAHVRRSLSHAQFEQMWTALIANGAKLKPTDPSKTIDGVNNYIFSLAEVRMDTGSRFIVPKTLIIPNRQAPASVVGVAQQIRELF